MYRSSSDGQYLADGTVVIDVDGIPVPVNSTTTGRAVMTASDAAAARGAIDAPSTADVVAADYRQPTISSGDVTTYDTPGAAEITSNSGTTGKPVATTGNMVTMGGTYPIRLYYPWFNSTTQAPTVWWQQKIDATWGTWQRLTWRGLNISTATDFDTVTGFGAYSAISSGITNGPDGQTNGVLEVLPWGSGIIQRFTSGAAGTTDGWEWTRRKSGSTWGTWKRNATTVEVAALEARVADLETRRVQSLRTVTETGDYRPDTPPEGSVAYWTGPSGVQRIGWDYKGDGYVGSLGRVTGYTTLQVKKVQTEGEVEVSCLNPTTGRHVTYRVQGVGGTGQDDQRRVEEGWVGTYTGSTVSKDHTILVRSNIEWAFQIEVGGNAQFAPYHGSTSCMATQYEPATITDRAGAPIDVDALALDGVLSDVDGFKVRQRLYLTHPDSGATKWASVDEVLTINPDGMLQSEAVVTFLQDTLLRSNYGPMTPVDQAAFDQMKVLSGSTYSVLTTPPATSEYLTITEGHATASVLFTSTSKPDAFVAMSYLDPDATLRRGEVGEETSTLAMRLEQRSTGGLTKLYPSVWASGTTVPAGTVWRPSAQWRYGETTNARQWA